MAHQWNRSVLVIYGLEEYSFNFHRLGSYSEPTGVLRSEPSHWCSVAQDEQNGRPLLGGILEDKFGLSEAKLLEAMNLQSTKGGRIGEILVRARAITEEQLLQALAIQFDLPWLLHLDVSQVDHEWVRKVPIHFARRYHVLPLKTENGSVLVATTDPMETAAFRRPPALARPSNQTGADR